MSNHPTLMVIESDKNLGQCVIERSKHKKLVHQHLIDANAYVQLTESEATSALSNAVADLFEIIAEAKEEYDMKLRTTCFEDSDETCVRRMIKQSKRHTQFYLLPKIHKNAIPIPTRPMVGAAGSQLFRMSKMLDSLLQPLLKRLPTYCSNSNQVIHQVAATMKKLKEKAKPTTKYFLVAVDAVSMCTNMLKDEIISNMRDLLNEKIMHVNNKFPIEETLKVLEIMLDNNVF